jgi:hypothetical protein
LSVGSLENINRSNDGDQFTASNNFSNIKPEPAEKRVLFLCGQEHNVRMSINIGARLSLWREIAWRPALALAGIPWGCLAAYNLLKSEFVPLDQQAKLQIRNILPWPWRVWALMSLGILVFVILEGAYRVIRNRASGMEAEHEQGIGKLKKDIATLTQGLEARGQQFIEAQQSNVANIMRGNRLQKELDRARVELINANDKIEFLTWPDNRPILSFHAWGMIQLQFLPPGSKDQSLQAQYGFYFANDGGAALDIEVEDFQITKLLIAVGGKVSRIEEGEEGFVPVWIKDEVPLSRWALDIALEKAWEEKVNENVIDPWSRQPLECTVSVIYRDHNKLWYRSVANLKYFAGSLYQDHIEFGPITQERHGLNKPVTRKL